MPKEEALMQPGTQQQKPQATRMSLASVTKGRLRKPKRVLLFGVEGIGKSTFGADAPDPIFLGAEDGTSELDVNRFPEPSGWADVMEAIRQLTYESHSHKTLVVDTLDWAEPMCWEWVCHRGGKKNIEDFGYGKGYSAALDEWRVLLDKLSQLRAAKGMDIILLAHSWTKTFKNPEGEDFDRYELKLHAKAGGLIKEWCDAVLFTNYETFAVQKEGRTRGVSSGARLIYTQRRAAWDAKNRYGLPETLPLSWVEFDAAVKAGSPDDPAKLLSMIAEVSVTLPKAAQDQIAGAIERASGNGQKLAQLLDWARGRAAIAGNESSAKEESTK
jgi:hypothetical protein